MTSKITRFILNIGSFMVTQLKNKKSSGSSSLVNGECLTWVESVVKRRRWRRVSGLAEMAVELDVMSCLNEDTKRFPCGSL